MDIETVLTLDDGDEIDELKGEVTSVYEQKSGKTSRGPRKGKRWTVQNFMLEESNGDNIKVGAWNMDDLSELEGKLVTLKRDMHFKDDGEYQSVELGKNTKIIEEGESESPTRQRKSAPREKGKTTNEKPASGTNRNDAIYWQTCLKVAGNIYAGSGAEAGDVIKTARELFNARPGSAPQEKVRKASFRTEPKKDPEPEPPNNEPEPGNEPPDDDDEVSL